MSLITSVKGRLGYYGVRFGLLEQNIYMCLGFVNIWFYLPEFTLIRLILFQVIFHEQFKVQLVSRSGVKLSRYLILS